MAKTEIKKSLLYIMLNILYADDDDALLQVGRLFLERNGQFSVETATTAPAALELLQTKPFDAIIADYMMPKMDGINFLKKVRAGGALHLMSPFDPTLGADAGL